MGAGRVSWRCVLCGGVSLSVVELVVAIIVVVASFDSFDYFFFGFICFFCAFCFAHALCDFLVFLFVCLFVCLHRPLFSSCFFTSRSGTFLFTATRRRKPKQFVRHLLRPRLKNTTTYNTYTLKIPPPLFNSLRDFRSRREYFVNDDYKQMKRKPTFPPA